MLTLWISPAIRILGERGSYRGPVSPTYLERTRNIAWQDFSGLFSDLRTERQESTQSRPVPPIEQMSFDEILAYLKSLGETVSVKECVEFLQRPMISRYLIIMFLSRIGTPQYKLVEILRAETEKATIGRPGCLVCPPSEANNSKFEIARLHGVGSLNWKIDRGVRFSC